MITKRAKHYLGIGAALLLFVGSASADWFKPVATEDFESAIEFSLPSGWAAVNSSDPDEFTKFVPGDETGILAKAGQLGSSDKMMGWNVVTTDTLKTLGIGDTHDGRGRLRIGEVVSGKSVFIDSEFRGASGSTAYTISYLYTPVYDLSKYPKAQIRFDSNLEQHGNSFEFAEYTLQGNLKNDDANKKWLPIFYWSRVGKVNDANGDFDTLLGDSTVGNFASYVGAQSTAVDFANMVVGKDDAQVGDENQVVAKTHETWNLAQAGGQQNVQIRFFYGSTNRWYWGIDNFAILGSVTGDAPKSPDAPSIASITPVNANAQEKATLNGSAFISKASATFKRAVWQVSVFSDFSEVTYSALNTTASLDIDSSRLPVGLSLHARVKYIDSNEIASEFSPNFQFTLAAGPKLVSVFSENFESTEEGKLPKDWTNLNLSDLSGGDYFVDLTSWTVQSWPLNTFWDLHGDFAAYSSVHSVVNGKCLIQNTDNYGPYSEAYVFTPKINLTGVKNVYLSYSESYVQNQDNIGSLEYTIDGGDVQDDGTGLPKVTGTFLPIAYYLDGQDNGGDVRYDAQGNIDAELTFDDGNTADGADYNYGSARPYNYYVLAYQTKSTATKDLAPFIYPRVNDDKYESKRFVKYRLAKADNQANVRIRWTQMGTNSWHWGVDDLIVWGDNGTNVDEWSLF